MSKSISPLFALVLIAALLHIIEGVLHSAIRILKFTVLAILLLVAISEHACGISAERLLSFGGRQWGRALRIGLRQANVELRRAAKLLFPIQSEGEQSENKYAE